VARFEGRNSPGSLWEHGAYLPLRIARPSEIEVTEPAPKETIEVRGLIDTGAQICAIRQSLADELDLQAVDLRSFGNSSGEEDCPIYVVDIEFDGKRRGFQTAGCSFAGQTIEFLIGRNLALVGAQLGVAGFLVVRPGPRAVLPEERELV